MKFKQMLNEAPNISSDISKMESILKMLKKEDLDSNLIAIQYYFMNLHLTNYVKHSGADIDVKSLENINNQLEKILKLDKN